MPNGIQYPYGDAFIVNTPHIYRVSQQLYLEQKQREAQRAQQAAQMDEEFRKNVSAIRDADVPDFTKKYEEWKQSRKNLMKMNPTKRDEFIAAQMDSQRKLADVYELANKSKSAKAEEETLYKGISTKPDNFSDEAYTLLTSRRKTPLSALRQYQYVSPTTGQTEVVDLTNPDTYRFKGIDFDLSKLLKDAKGIPQQRYTTEEPIPNDDLQTKITPYYFGNSPNEYKDAILGGLYTRKGGQFAERQLDAMNPDLIMATQDQFKKLPKDKWKQMTGSDTPQDLIIKDDDSKAVKFAKHMAQLYAINESPEKRTPIFKLNQQAKDARDFAQAKALKGMELANAMRLAQWKKANGISETGDDGLWIDEHIKDKINNGKPAKYYDDRTKQWMDVKEISLDPVFEAGLSVNKQSPDFAYVLPSGEIRYGLYKRKLGADGKPTNEFVTDNGKKSVDMTNVRTISQGDLKLSIAKEAGVKQMNKEMSGQPNQPNTQAASDSYSRSELKKAGWTDAQISTAVKAGKIKVND